MNNDESRSDTQAELEGVIIGLLGQLLTLEMATVIQFDNSISWPTVAKSLSLGDAWEKAHPDGCYWDGKQTLILVECFARAVAPKAGQVRKVAKDALKLATIKKIVEGPGQEKNIAVRCIIVMPCDIVGSFRNDGWLSAAFKENGVEIYGVKLSDSQLVELKTAQQRQAANMARGSKTE